MAKKGIQVDPELVKAGKYVADKAIEFSLGPGVQAVKGIYNYFNTPKQAEEKKSVDEGKGPIRPTPPTNVIKEGIKTYLPKSKESKPPTSEEKLGSLTKNIRPITNKPLPTLYNIFFKFLC